MVRPIEGLALGRVLGERYRVEARLGRGGYGTVYQGQHVRSGRPVAIKTLLADAVAVTEIAARFEREARAQSLLDHPNIVDVLDLGPLEEGGLFLVMELIRGPTVGELVIDGALAPARAFAIARQVLDALGHAHERGLVHRDLKPDNLMLASERGGERVKLLDFGLVKLVGGAAAALEADKLTRTGVVFGTPAYMSPEQALGRPVDGRADLYALGVILYEMLSGRRPFAHRDPTELMRLHVKVPAPALAAAAPAAVATPAVEALLARALAKPPADRYPDAAAMAAAVDGAAASIAGTIGA